MEHNDEHIRKHVGNTHPQENYKVPTGYFDSFSAKVKQRIETQPKKGFSLGHVLRPVYTIPAAAAIAIIAGYFMFFAPVANVQPTQTAVAEDTTAIPPALIQEYLAQDVSLLGVEDEAEQDFLALAYNIDTEEAPATTAKMPQNSNDSSLGIPQQEIEEYLLYTDEDVFENL